MIDPAPETSFAALHACAEGGDPQAQYNLGLEYARGGDGRERDLLQAYAWLSLGIAQDHPNAASARAAVARQLAPGALLVARDLARRYFDLYFRRGSAAQHP